MDKHEPVYAFRRKGLDDFCTCDKRRYDELVGKPNLFEVAVFYTAPPKRDSSSWVGLTDEEIKKIAKKHKWHEGNVEPHLMPVFRSLEAKLKEKNS